MEKFLIKQDTVKHKKGDIIEMRQGFWSRYYQIKGIIQPIEQLDVQEAPKVKKTTKKKAVKK